MEKMVEGGIVVEEETIQIGDEEKQTEEKLLEEDPDIFRKSRKEKQRESIHEEAEQCLNKRRRLTSRGLEEKDGMNTTTGGPGHHHGGGTPHQQINTRACAKLQPSKYKYNTVPEGWKKKFFQSEGETIRTQFSLVDNQVEKGGERGRK